MNRFFKPASLLYYFLTFLLAFLLGSTIASLSGAADNQGLAAAAIVVGYGILVAILLLVAAIVSVAYLTPKKIVNLNKILGILAVLMISVLVVRGILRNKKEDADEEKQPVPKTTSLLAQATTSAVTQQIPAPPEMGLGMVKPDFYNHSTLYFYRNPNLQKAVNEHLPYDSLVFRQTELGYEITYAPPWFVPAVMKMDYDVLYLRANTLHREFLQVTVNETNGQTAWIGRFDAKLIYWPEFLLSVNTIEPMDPVNNPLRIKPMNHASPVNTKYAFLRPTQVKTQWMEVELLDDALQVLDTGWLRWHEEGRLVVEWSLFS